MLLIRRVSHDTRLRRCTLSLLSTDLSYDKNYHRGWIVFFGFFVPRLVLVNFLEYSNCRIILHVTGDFVVIKNCRNWLGIPPRLFFSSVYIVFLLFWLFVSVLWLYIFVKKCIMPSAFVCDFRFQYCSLICAYLFIFSVVYSTFDRFIF